MIIINCDDSSMVKITGGSIKDSGATRKTLNGNTRHGFSVKCECGHEWTQRSPNPDKCTHCEGCEKCGSDLKVDKTIMLT